METFARHASGDAISAFKAASLHVGDCRKVVAADYGGAPQLALEGTRFSVPFLEDRAGRVLAFASQAGLEEVRGYFDRRTNARTFVHANLLLILPGDLPNAYAGRYERALRSVVADDQRKVRSPVAVSRLSNMQLGGLALLGLVGLYLERTAATRDEYPPLVAACLVLLPLAGVVGWLGVGAKGPKFRTAEARAAVGVAFLIVATLPATALAIERCDRRGEGVVLRGCDLAGKNLAGDSLSSADLSDADLRGARMVNVNLEGATLTGALLERVDLSGARLGRARLAKVKLTEAKAAKASFAGADLTEANLASADLTEADLSGAGLRGASLEGAELAGANLSSSILSSATLRKARLRGTRLTDTDIKGTRFDAADLSRASLVRAKGERAVLSGAVLAGADLTGAQLVGSDLRAAQVSNASLADANLTAATMSGVTLKNVALDRAVFTDAQGLANPTLAGALGVDQARLSRAVNERSVVFDRRERVVEAVSPACRGSGIPGAAGFSPSPEFHAVVVLDGEGKASGPVEMLRSLVAQARWEPAGVRFAELVACVDNPSWVVVQRCPNYVHRTTGVRGTFTRQQLGRKVRVVAAATGQPVTERTFLGPTPRACAPTEFTSSFSGATEFTIQGEEVAFENDIKAWLAGFVRL